MNITSNNEVGEVVTLDYRTAAVFKSYGIDFCCKGNRSIAEVCENRKIEEKVLMDNLNSVLKKQENSAIDYQSWPLDLLADYVEKKHHRYVEQQSVVLKQYLNKLCKVHGSEHPELFEITEHFVASAGELAMHMKKEELVLFPFIKKMVKAEMAMENLESPHFGSVKNPVEMMMHEHDAEGERFRKIEALSSGYTPPADACNTYRVTYALLQEFEQDLHLHIHLENNILFPKAIALEKKLSA